MLSNTVFLTHIQAKVLLISDERFHVTYLYSAFHAKLLNNVKHQGPAALRRTLSRKLVTTQRYLYTPIAACRRGICCTAMCLPYPDKCHQAAEAVSRIWNVLEQALPKLVIAGRTRNVG